MNKKSSVTLAECYQMLLDEKKKRDHTPQYGKDESKENLAENIAAISAVFHSDIKRYQIFYNRFSIALGGFPAIWKLMVPAAEAFTTVIESIKDVWTELEWIDVVDSFVDLIYDKSLVDEDYSPTLDTKFFSLCAQQALKQNRR